MPRPLLRQVAAWRMAWRSPASLASAALTSRRPGTLREAPEEPLYGLRRAGSDAPARGEVEGVRSQAFDGGQAECVDRCLGNGETARDAVHRPRQAEHRLYATAERTFEVWASHLDVADGAIQLVREPDAAVIALAQAHVSINRSLQDRRRQPSDGGQVMPAGRPPAEPWSLFPSDEPRYDRLFDHGLLRSSGKTVVCP